MYLDRTKPSEEMQMDTGDLTCPICMCIASDPQITSCCHRVFCAKDANINHYDNGCPLCREQHFSFQSSSKHKEMLERLTIKCICSEYIAPEEYENHIARCSNVEFICPHDGCRKKNDLRKYNSRELVKHLAQSHCDEVSLLGSTYINKSSAESYKKTLNKYDDLVSTLYSVLYPKMIDMQMTNSSLHRRNSSIFKCPHGHKLIEADHAKRKRKNSASYTSPGYNCDICHHSFFTGCSWHCSCTDSGFDKCPACFVFQLYTLDNQILKLASQDKEKQQKRSRDEAVRNIIHLPQGLRSLLNRNIAGDDDDDDDSDPDFLVLRHQSPFLYEPNTNERTSDEESESHMRED